MTPTLEAGCDKPTREQLAGLDEGCRWYPEYEDVPDGNAIEGLIFALVFTVIAAAATFNVIGLWRLVR